MVYYARPPTELGLLQYVSRTEVMIEGLDPWFVFYTHTLLK